jgi:dipeptidyl aminopeptidase/acylaminoacyl peptidase
MANFFHSPSILVRRTCIAGATFIGLVSLTHMACGAVENGVHRFLEIGISPNGRYVASVEGDTSPSGGEPVVRSLVVRTSDGKRSVFVKLPCGTVRECWPSSPAWSADGKTLAFALRKPGSHARSVFTVARDGSHLTERVAFNGTIDNLRFGPGGRLAMLAIEGANKEVGATQAGAPITGDVSGPGPEQRIGILEGDKLHWASPANMFVYEYNWLPNGNGFVGTAAYGDGDNNWWVAKLYRFASDDRDPHIIYTPPDSRHQISDPVISRDGNTVAFIGGLMSDFGSVGAMFSRCP